MPRIATGDAAEIENALGERGALTVTIDNRNDVRRWLRARGLPSAVVQGLSMSVLAKAYNDEADFEALNSAIRTIEQGAGKQREENREEIAAMINEDNAPAQAPQPVASQPVTPPQAAQPPKKAGNDIAQAITAAIAAALAGMPATLDEDRVREIAIEEAKRHTSQPIIEQVVIQIAGQEPRILDNEHRHEVFPDVLRKVGAGVHVYLVGPAGSGKSTIAEQCARALERALYAANAVQSPFALTGYMDAAGNYHRTPFRDAYENGGIFLFDEMDASSADALTTFNGALAQSRFAFPDGMIDRHAGFVCIAAANTFGNGADRLYVGRQQLDAATLDRYAFVAMNYDEKFEAAISSNVAWTRRVQAIRAAVSELKIRHVVSPRASIMGARLLKAGEDRKSVEQALIWKGLDRDTIAKIDQTAHQYERNIAAE